MSRKESRPFCRDRARRTPSSPELSFFGRPGLRAPGFGGRPLAARRDSLGTVFGGGALTRLVTGLVRRFVFAFSPFAMRPLCQAANDDARGSVAVETTMTRR